MKVRHKKTGRIYKVFIPSVVDTTNERAALELKMVVYYHDDDPSSLFVRELKEFWEKFELIPSPTRLVKCCYRCGETKDLIFDPLRGFRCDKLDCWEV